MPLSWPLKISYCTTCKGRLHHLKQTLPANMAAEKDNPNVEFVVLDYGSEDGLGDWIKSNFQAEMKSGRLRYARYESDHFKMAHAKNMAHRLATGDVLCNVDADNFIATDFSKFLREAHSSGANLVSTLTLAIADMHVRAAKIIAKQPVEKTGIRGRVSVDKQLFYQINGYDESVEGARWQDFDFGLRSKNMGAKFCKIPKLYWGESIDHTDDERTQHFASSHKAHADKKLALGIVGKYMAGLKKLASCKYSLVNPNGNVGCGTVHINFSEAPTEIVALPAQGVGRSVRNFVDTPASYAEANWKQASNSGHPTNWQAWVKNSPTSEPHR